MSRCFDNPDCLDRVQASPARFLVEQCEFGPERSIPELRLELAYEVWQVASGDNSKADPEELSNRLFALGCARGVTTTRSWYGLSLKSGVQPDVPRPGAKKTS